MDQGNSNSQGSIQNFQTNGVNHEDEQFSEQEALERQIAEVNEALDHHRTFLARFINVVSRGEQEAVDRLVDTIRSGASHEQIFETLGELGANIRPLNS